MTRDGRNGFDLQKTMAHEDFYVRYYVGHEGKFGHEFLEFEFRPDGKVRQEASSNRMEQNDV